MRPLPSRRRTLVSERGVLQVTWYTPQQITTVHALRRQGYTYKQICALTGWSFSAVQRMVGLVLLDPVAQQEAARRQERAAALADTIPLP